MSQGVTLFPLRSGRSGAFASAATVTLAVAFPALAFVAFGPTAIILFLRYFAFMIANAVIARVTRQTTPKLSHSHVFRDGAQDRHLPDAFRQ